MGRPRVPGKVKLIVGLLSGDVAILEKTAEKLARRFGPCDYASELIDFTETRYYDEELGRGIKRRFLGFARARSPERLHHVKLWTNKLEHKLSRKGRRTVNIDPGYLTLSKLVLFTTKDYAHRIYLGRGVFAETTLAFRNGDFEPFPWTYPDYRTDRCRSIFTRMRQEFRAHAHPMRPS
jgi:Domain of unknown function (DUF4416)